MATIGSVEIKLGGDASDLSRTLSKAGSSLSGTVGNIAKSFGGMAGSLGSALGSAISAVASFAGEVLKWGGIILGTLTAIGAFTFGVLVKNVSDLGDSLLNLSVKTGISVESLSALRLAANLNEVEFDDLAMALKFMLRNLANTDEESQKAKKGLEDVGLTAADATRAMSDPEGFLEMFAKGLAKIESPAKRVQVAMDVMSRSGANMIPMLLDIANRGMAGVRRESDALGNTFSTKLAVASDNFGDNLTRLKATMNGFIREAIGPVVVALTAMTEMFLKSDIFAAMRAQFEAFKKAGVFEEFAKSFVLGMVDVIAKGAQFIATAFDVITVYSVQAFNALSKGAQSAMAAMFIFSGSVKDSILALLPLLPLILAFASGLAGLSGNYVQMAALGATALALSMNMETLLATVNTAGTKLEKTFFGATQALAKFNTTPLVVPESVTKVGEKLHTMADGVTDFANKAKSGFNQVAASVQRAGDEAPQFAINVTESRNAAGELVTSFQQVSPALATATRQAGGLKQEMAAVLQLTREINANPVRPVQ